MSKKKNMDGWRTVTLPDLAENHDRRRVPLTKADRTSGPYPYYGASGVVDYVEGYLFEGDTLLISEDGANLLARSTPIAFPATGKYWVNNHAHILRFHSGITQRLVELYLESIPLDSYITGTAQPKLNQSALNSIPITIPISLQEQERIVASLDEAFEGIDRAISNSEMAMQHTRNMTSSYFDASLNGRQSWQLLPIESCFKVRSGDFLSAKQMDVFGSVPVYGGNGIAGYHTSANLAGDNVIVGRVGEKCGNVRNVRGRLWLTDNAFYISEFLQPFDPEFLAIRLEAENLRQTANQTAQPVISYSTIKKIELSFPASISEQKLVVESLNALSAAVESLQASIKAKIAALKELKQSLLQQAFSGNL